jgi:Fic family protein
VADLFRFQEQTLRPYLRRLDGLREALDARPLVIGWQQRLASDLMAEAIQASTNMEGVPVTVEEVRRILAGDRPSSVSAKDASLVTGYRDAMTYCQRRADDDVFSWSPELIKAIQDRILAGRSDWGAGRYGKGRFVQNSATGQLIYTPPQEGVRELVEQLCRRMNTWDGHPALMSAWVHIALAAIHPFKDGNGRTARVLASLAMYRGGFKRSEFTSLEEWWGTHRTEYADAFRCLGSTFDPTVDVTPFMFAHVSAQVRQVQILQNVERSRRRVWNGIEALMSRHRLPDRTQGALWEAFWGRTITRPYYIAMADVKGPTASKDLLLLTTLKLLREDGRTRAKRWQTGPEFFPQLGGEFGLSPDESNQGSIIDKIVAQVVREASEISKWDDEEDEKAPPGQTSLWTTQSDANGAARPMSVGW